MDRQLSGALCDAVLADVRRHHPGRGLVERQGRRLPHVREHGLHGEEDHIPWSDITPGLVADLATPDATPGQGWNFCRFLVLLGSRRLYSLSGKYSPSIPFPIEPEVPGTQSTRLCPQFHTE